MFTIYHISNMKHINPFHIHPPYFFTIHVIIILTRISSILTFYSYRLWVQVRFYRTNC